MKRRLPLAYGIVAMLSIAKSIVIAALSFGAPMTVFGGEREIVDAILSKLKQQHSIGSLKGFDINLSVEEGKVLIGGAVANHSQLDSIMKIANKTVGVTQVVNNVMVQPTLGAATATALQSPDGQNWNVSVNVKVDWDADVKRLVERIKNSEIDGETKSVLRVELLEKLLKQFAEMESERKQQIEVIEKRIQKVKATLDMRAQNAEKIVENRISQLLGEPSSLSWDYAIPDDADEARVKANSEAKAAKLKEEALDSNLLLGYGLALSTFEEKRKVFEESLAKQKELEAVVSDAEARASLYAKQLNGEKMNDPNLSTKYRETISQVEEKMRKVEELMKSLQTQKRELSILELELLPLKNEVERIYGKEATSKPVDQIPETKPKTNTDSK